MGARIVGEATPCKKNVKRSGLDLMQWDSRNTVYLTSLRAIGLQEREPIRLGDYTHSLSLSKDDSVSRWRTEYYSSYNDIGSRQRYDWKQAFCSGFNRDQAERLMDDLERKEQAKEKKKFMERQRANREYSNRFRQRGDPAYRMGMYVPAPPEFDNKIFKKDKSKYKRWLYRRYIVDIDDGLGADEKVKLLVREVVWKHEKKFNKLSLLSDVDVKVSKADRRKGLPEDVRMFVWRRDEGKCVQCGSKENLEFDHIIPVSKGGSNTARNLQILCEKCNRSKGANI